MTQVPFENNRLQFWKMVESSQSNLIMLCSEIGPEEQVLYYVLMNRRNNCINSFVSIHKL